MNRLAYLSLLLVAPLAACEMDNYPSPNAELTGRVVYEGEPIHVRQNAIQLELWQDGYDLRREIPVHLHQDGTFAARLFDGVYKLVLKEGNGPWRNAADTVLVTVTGSESVDVPVEPFYLIDGASVTRNGTTLTATFQVEQVVDGSMLERVALYVGTSHFVDSRYSEARVEQEVNAASSPGSFSLSVDLGDSLADEEQLFARVGAKTAGVEEMIYTPVATLEQP